MNLSDKIIAAAEKLGPQKADLDALRLSLKQLTDQFEDGDNADELLVQMEDISGQIEKLAPTVDASQKQLDLLRKAEKSLMERAKPVAPEIISGTPAYKGNPGSLMAKEALVMALAHIGQVPPAQILATRFKDDKHVNAIMQVKSAVAPADTTTAGWAAELVRTEMSGFLDMLATRSVGAGLATRSMQLDFAGAGSVTIPRMNDIGAGQTEPAWVGEGGVIPLQKFSLGAATLNRYKLASIVPLTMELAEMSTPAALGIFENAMQEAYVRMLDTAILSASAAVAGVRPAGMLHGVTVGTADTTGGFASVVADVRTLLSKLTSAGLGMDPVLILNEEDFTATGMLLNPLGQLPFQADAANGVLMGLPVLHSRNVTKGTAVIIDAGALATAFDGPNFRVSQEATLTMANADTHAPTQADDGSGGAGTAGEVPPKTGGIDVVEPAANLASGKMGEGYTARNLFQTYSEAVRGIWPTSWAELRPGSVAALSALKW